MENLTQKKCEPCEGGVPPMPDDKAEEMLKQTPGWEKEGKKIQREFKFKDFLEAMKFVNKVAELAESEDHQQSGSTLGERYTLIPVTRS